MHLMATLPPLDDHGSEIAAHPCVERLRFNSIMRTPWPHRETLERLLDKCRGKPLLLDLKTRQLRVERWSEPWFQWVELSHPIEVETPTAIYFKTTKATIKAVRGSMLLLTDVPEEPLGKGTPVNILDPSLRIKGFLTEDDLAYREAAKELGIHDVALSFVEQLSDVLEYLRFDPEVRLWAKIESERGVEFVRRHFAALSGRLAAAKHCGAGLSLMIARGDLYVNAGDDRTRYLDWEQELLAADPEAIVASRILSSLQHGSEVSLGDLKDLEDLYRRGVKTLMLADGTCKIAEAFRGAMRVWAQVQARWERRQPEEAAPCVA